MIHKIIFWNSLFLLFSCAALAAASSGDFFKAGSNLYRQGDFAKAADNFEAAVKADPGHWEAYQDLGNCRYKLKDYPQALEAYERSLDLHPDNPKLKAFANSLRPQVTPTDATAAPALPSLPTADPQTLVADFYSAKNQEENSRDGLRLYGQTYLLTQEQNYLAQWGAPPSSFFTPHADVQLGILTPTFANLDIGFFVDPTTNIGVASCYVPLTEYDYNYDEEDGYPDSYSISGDLVYFEPRIKFYSAPSGLTSYHGFSFIYYGLHQGKDSTGYANTNFDIFGLGYLFGFRTLPSDGLTMELGWKMGLAVIIVTTMEGSEFVNEDTPVWTYTYYYTPVQTIVPFPYIIPEFRFGFTF